MKSILLTWIGKTDLDAARGVVKAGTGPIAQALEKFTFDEVVLLSNDPPEAEQEYLAWLEPRTSAKLVVRHQDLSSPTNYSEIYAFVLSVVTAVREGRGASPHLTFHLSPGTPAMTAIWIIVAKTQAPARLIESSRVAGVQEAHIPFEISAEFVPALVRPVEAELEKVADAQRPEGPEFSSILHRSAVMKRLLERARDAAPFNVSVLIEGESGTGKELLAEAIHRASPRRRGPFIAVNCGAVSPNLVESEFFGHTKRAFTGADAERRGHFEEANGGTLFLDEVGELPLDAQVKLLRALQRKKIVRVGTSKEIAVDVRIVAATNRQLLDEVNARRFREDLYYRLAVLTLVMPPLRERQGDMGLLLDHFLEVLNTEQVPTRAHKKLSPGAKNLLLRHRWPGNVRELQATLTRAFVWSRGASISENEAREALGQGADQITGDVLNRALGEGFSLDETVAEVERHYLERAAKDAAGSKTKAAALVGFANYQTFTNRARKVGLDV